MSENQNIIRTTFNAELERGGCDHCQSVLSPAAYFVKLVETIKTYITQPTGELSLEVRRPDLFKLPLDCNSTNKTKLYLEIVNEIMEKNLDTRLGGNALKELANTNTKVKDYLKNHKLDDLYKDLSLARELGISYEDCKSITSEADLKGLAKDTKYSSINAYLKKHNVDYEYLYKKLSLVRELDISQEDYKLITSDILKKLATTKYPFNLPANFPLISIRAYLEKQGVSLADLYKTLKLDADGFAELSGLLPEEYKIITSTENSENELKKLYNLQDNGKLDELNEVNTFINKTSINQEKLELLLDNYNKIKGLTDAEKLIINSTNKTINNLNTKALSFLYHFIHLAGKYSWSFEDLKNKLITINNADNTFVAESLSLSPEEYELIISPQATEPYLKKVYGADYSINQLKIVKKFISQVSTGYDKLEQLLDCYNKVKNFTDNDRKKADKAKFKVVELEGKLKSEYAIDTQLSKLKEDEKQLDEHVIIKEEKIRELKELNEEYGIDLLNQLGAKIEKLTVKRLREKHKNASLLSGSDEKESVYLINLSQNQFDKKEISVDIINGLDKQALGFLHRFIRLANKLSWSFDELSNVLIAIDKSEINADSLKQISRIKNLQEKFKKPLDKVFELYSHSLPDSISKKIESLPKELCEQIKSSLKENYQRLKDLITTENDRSILQSILSINDRELTDLISSKNNETTSNKTGKYWLLEAHKQVLLARLINIPIAELMQILSLSNIDELSADKIEYVAELTDLLKEHSITSKQLDGIINFSQKNTEKISAIKKDIKEKCEKHKGNDRQEFLNCISQNTSIEQDILESTYSFVDKYLIQKEPLDKNLPVTNGSIVTVDDQTILFNGEKVSVYNNNAANIENSCITHNTEARANPSIAIIGEKAIFFGGKRGDVEYSKQIDIYDAKEGKINSQSCWIPTEASEARENALVTVVDNEDKGKQVIFFGGNKKDGLSNKIDVYDFTEADSKKCWKTHTASEARKEAKVAVVGDKVVFFGGITPSNSGENQVRCSNKVDIYDVEKKILLKDKITEGRLNPAVAVINNKAIFFGGHSNNRRGETVPTSEGERLDHTDNKNPMIDIYDAENDEWESTSYRTHARGDVAVAVVDKKAIFFGGRGSGQYSQGFSSTIDIYNDAAVNTNEQWTKYKDNKVEARCDVSIAVIDKKAIFFGGMNDQGYSKQINIYDDNNQEAPWSIHEASEGRSDSTIVTIDKEVIFFCGTKDQDSSGNPICSNKIDIYDSAEQNTQDCCRQYEASEGRVDVSFAIVDKKVIFFGGKKDNGLYSSKIDIYDSETKNWITVETHNPLKEVRSIIQGKKVTFIVRDDKNNIQKYTIDYDTVVEKLLENSNLFLFSKLQSEDIENIVKHGQNHDITIPWSIDINRIKSILKYKTLRNKFSNFTKHLDWFYGPDYNESKVVKKIVNITGWNADTLKDIQSDEDFKKCFTKEVNPIDSLFKITSVIDLVGKSKINANLLLKLKELSKKSAQEDWNEYKSIEESLKLVTKIDEKEDKIIGSLEEKKCNILSSYMMHYSKDLKKYTNNKSRVNKRDLSSYLLIDVEMSDCSKISQLKAGLNSLQLYIHRCILGFEEGATVSPGLTEEMWDLLDNYREWQVTKKIALYPENYLNPTLRKSATAEYRALQDALTQGSVTNEEAANAYIKYFEDFSQLVNLRIVDICVVSERELCILGRTTAEPYIYYYRVGDLVGGSKGGKAVDQQTWKPWQKIEMHIPVRIARIIYAFGRIFVFWLQKTEKEKQIEDVSINDSTLSVNYVFKKVDGSWSAQQKFPYEIKINGQYEQKIREHLNSISLHKQHIAGRKEDDKENRYCRDEIEKYKGFIKSEVDTLRNIKFNGKLEVGLSSSQEILIMSREDGFNNSGFVLKEDLEPTVVDKISYSSGNDSAQIIKSIIDSYDKLRQEDEDDIKDKRKRVERIEAEEQELSQREGNLNYWEELEQGIKTWGSLQEEVGGLKEQLKKLCANGTNGLIQSLQTGEGELSLQTEINYLKQNITDNTTSLETLISEISQLKVEDESADESQGKLKSIIEGKLKNIIEGKLNGPIKKEILQGIRNFLKQELEETIGKINQLKVEVEDETVELREKLQNIIKKSCIQLQVIDLLGKPAKKEILLGIGNFLEQELSKLEQNREKLQDLKTLIGEINQLKAEDDTADLQQRLKEIIKQPNSVVQLQVIDLLNEPTKKEILQGIGDVLKSVLEALVGTINQLETDAELQKKLEGIIARSCDQLQVVDLLDRSVEKEILQVIVSKLKLAELKGSIENCKTELDEIGTSASSLENEIGKFKWQTTTQKWLKSEKEKLEKDVSNVVKTAKDCKETIEEIKKKKSSLIQQRKEIEKDITETAIAERKNELKEKEAKEKALVEKLIEQKNSDNVEESKYKDVETLKLINSLYKKAYIDRSEAILASEVQQQTLDFKGFYGVYLWEIFFHIPTLIAYLFNQEQKFAEARKWYQYIFNPLKKSCNAWQFVPFKTKCNSQDNNNEKCDSGKLVDSLDPYKEAYNKKTSFEKYIIMSYVDNLIDWGDLLFSQNSWEGINQATVLYIRAWDLLGEKPKKKGKLKVTSKNISGLLCTAGHAIYEVEAAAPSGTSQQHQHTITSSCAINTTKYCDYFCTPENEKFISLWDTIEDRLYKIRHCLDIKGKRLELPLFQPPIDPRQLISAAAGGSTIILPKIAQVPHYRFKYMITYAKSIADTVTQIGSELLGVLEKKDAEALNLLYNKQEGIIANLMTTIKEKAIEALKEEAKALNVSLNSAKHRKSHYEKLISGGILDFLFFGLPELVGLNGLSVLEITAMGLSAAAVKTLTISLGPELASAVAYLMPNIFGFSCGGSDFGEAVKVSAETLRTTSNILSNLSQNMSTFASYQRRAEDWDLQKTMATYDVDQINHQIKANEINQKNAEQDLNVHRKSIEQIKEKEEFFRSKFTNQELYSWMKGELKSLYIKVYRLALEIARQAELAYQYEIDSNKTFVQPGHWNSLKEGLLSGQKLKFDLEQLDKEYHDKNERRLEITKAISLKQLDPIALYKLKTKGSCKFSFTEKLFDLDFPGHYARKIKDIKITIPAVVGPYENVHASLLQTSNQVVLKSDRAINAIKYLVNPSKEEQPENDLLRINWKPNQEIAISKADQDSGLFELSFGDERYLPFEGTGAVSTWELNLPQATNRFDISTISDVIIHLDYTALNGGQVLSGQVKNLDQIKYYQGTLVLNLSAVYHEEWEKFKQANGQSSELKFKLSKEVFPVHVNEPEVYLDNDNIYVIPITSDISRMAIKVNNYAWKHDSKEILNPSLTIDSDWSIKINNTDISKIEEIMIMVPYKAEINWKAEH